MPKLPEGLGDPVERGEGEGEQQGTEPGRTGRLREMGDVRLGDVETLDSERLNPRSGTESETKMSRT